MRKMRKMPLGSVSTGATITIWNRKFTVLRRFDQDSLVLANDIVASMPFHKGKAKWDEPNNFAYSPILSFLNGRYIDGMVQDGANRIHFDPYQLDLTSATGDDTYGTVCTRAAPLTLKQFWGFRELIPPCEGTWWLATPHETIQGEKQVWAVSPSSYEPIGCGKVCGVRPALLLSRYLDVEADIAPENDPFPQKLKKELDRLGQIDQKFETAWDAYDFVSKAVNRAYGADLDRLIANHERLHC